MRFSSPLFLLLLGLLPLLAWMGWPAGGAGRRRETVSLMLRLAIALALILALAGLEISRPGEELAVVFLVDASDSMPEAAQAAALDYAGQALAGMQPTDQAALILFGSDALVERPMSGSRELGPVNSIPATSQTDLAEAIRLGLALFPSGAARRMVILSDGNATTGDAASAARLAQASGVEIVVVPFIPAAGAETLVSAVEVPSRLIQGERFGLRVTVEASQATRAGVRVLAGGQVLYEGEQQIDRGVQAFNLPLVAGEPGFTRFTVQIAPAADGHYQNNELAAFSQVAGPPKVLVVAPPAGEALPQGAVRPDEAAALVSALEAAGFIVERVRPSGLPSELARLSEYASVVVVDVPARQLSRRQMAAVQSYVRDLGGGLVAVGGPTSYGVGGYFRTPLEETLPVEMQIKDEQRRPTLTMVFIIDHSGSMSDTSGGVTKLELAKEAAARSVELLFPTDRVGVIAFDDSASWVVDITPLDNPVQVINAIGSIRSGGGTDILAGLQAMARALPADPAQIKHVILLTDGGADPTGIPELVAKLNTEDRITLTTVGVGSDAAPFLADLAEIGGGRYHFAEDPASIPSIFTEETTLATRSYIIEETFTPKLQNPSPILTGLDALPPLRGYVGTSSKPTAQTILISEKGDPILAAWQYGLGKAVAFTSDGGPQWAQDWLSWAGYPAFWAQAVRYTISEPNDSALDVAVITEVEQTGETARLVVDAAGENGAYLNDYTMQANIVAPNGQVVALDLPQIAPGRYAAAFTPGGQGVYLVRVEGAAPGGGASVAQTIGWVRSYSPEYASLQADPDALVRLAAVAGGRVAGREPGEVFAHTLPAPVARRPIWPGLLILAAALLPLDIAVRRLAMDWREIRRAWEKGLARLRRAPAKPVAPAARSERVRQLLQAKVSTKLDLKGRGNAGGERIPDSLPGELSAFGAPPPAPDSRVPAESGSPREGAPSSGRESVLTEGADAGDAAVPPTASILLARKKERQQRRQM